MVPWFMDRGGVVLAMTKPSWVSWVGGAHGFDVVADVVNQGGAEVVYWWVVVVLLMVD